MNKKEQAEANVAEILESGVQGTTTADDLSDDGQRNKELEGIDGDDGDTQAEEDLLEELAGEEDSSDGESDNPLSDLPSSDTSDDECND